MNNKSVNTDRQAINRKAADALMGYITEAAGFVMKNLCENVSGTKDKYIKDNIQRSLNCRLEKWFEPTSGVIEGLLPCISESEVFMSLVMSTIYPIDVHKINLDADNAFFCVQFHEFYESKFLALRKLLNFEVHAYKPTTSEAFTCKKCNMFGHSARTCPKICSCEGCQKFDDMWDEPIDFFNRPLCSYKKIKLNEDIFKDFAMQTVIEEVQKLITLWENQYERIAPIIDEIELSNQVM